MSISAHSLVKNEERFLWYSVMSIINHVDEILLWDTGSTDGSIVIERELQKQFPNKVKLGSYKDIDKDRLTALRQRMLEQAKSDWILLLDGDEVWWEDSIVKIKSASEENADRIDSVVTPFINVVGDIYHYQEDRAGKYKIDGRVGNLTIRAFRKNIPGIHYENPYGKEGLFYKDGLELQKGISQRRIFCGAPFMHFSHVFRSLDRLHEKQVMMRSAKYKYEIGNKFPKDFYYPEVFFRPRPDIVASPWKAMNPNFKFRAFIETPVRKIKRGLWRAINHGKL